MFIRTTILLLCLVGLYASTFMYRKTKRAERGEVREPSVVRTRSARALGGIPNAAFGIAYYALLLFLAPALANPQVWWVALAAASAAAAFSAFLAYDLLFVTRAACPYCWASHLVNWAILALIIVLRPQ
jgi:uncharacterized membrane protein